MENIKWYYLGGGGKPATPLPNIHKTGTKDSFILCVGVGSIAMFVNDGQLVCYELHKYAEVICFSSLSPVLLSSDVAQMAGKKLQR